MTFGNMSSSCKTVKKFKKAISSSDSEDENLQNLQSAIDPTFNCNGKILDTKKQEIKFTSNRNIDDLNKKYSEVNATPEFRNFVAKKLTQRLDSQIKYVDKKLVANDVPETQNLGVKLLYSSRQFVKIDDEEESKPEKKIVVKTINDFVDTSSDEEFNEKLASVAVSPEWIITGQALYNNIEMNKSSAGDRPTTETNGKDCKETLKTKKKKKKSRET